MDGERAVLIGILVTVGTESMGCGKNWQHFTRVSYFVDWIIDQTSEPSVKKALMSGVVEEPSKAKQIFTAIGLILLILSLIAITIFVVVCSYKSEITFVNNDN